MATHPWSARPTMVREEKLTRGDIDIAKKAPAEERRDRTRSVANAFDIVVAVRRTEV